MDIFESLEKTGQGKEHLEAQKVCSLLLTSLFGAYRAQGVSHDDAWKNAVLDLKWLLDNKKLFGSLLPESGELGSKNPDNQNT